jgi:hypothetical protein
MKLSLGTFSMALDTNAQANILQSKPSQIIFITGSSVLAIILMLVLLKTMKRWFGAFQLACSVAFISIPGQSTLLGKAPSSADVGFLTAGHA